MKASEKNGRGGGMAAALLVVAVLGLFSLTGCASAPYMPNPVDVAAGSEEDPFAGTRWEYGVEGGGYTSQTGNLAFYKDGTVSWTGAKPKKYTVVHGDDGKYMAEINGGVLNNSLWLTIDTPNSTEGHLNVKGGLFLYYMDILNVSATKK